MANLHGESLVAASMGAFESFFALMDDENVALEVELGGVALLAPLYGATEHSLLSLMDTLSVDL